MQEQSFPRPTITTGSVLQLIENRLVYRDTDFTYERQWLEDTTNGYRILHQQAATTGYIQLPKPARIIQENLFCNCFHILDEKNSINFARAQLSNGLLPIDGKLQPLLGQMLFVPLNIHPDNLSPKANAILTGQDLNLIPRKGSIQMAVLDTSISILTLAADSFAIFSHCSSYRPGSNNVIKYNNSDNAWTFTQIDGIWHVQVNNRNNTPQYEEQLDKWNTYLNTKLIGNN